MEPIAIVTALVAALYIFGRGPLVAAPAATAASYRHLLSTPARMRIFGGLLVLLAAALVVTAREARDAQGGITILIEGFGWYAAAAAVWIIAAPGPWWRLMDSFWDALSSDPELLRGIGVLNVLFGLFWCLVALSVM